MREIKLSDLKSKTAAELLAFAEEHEVENASLLRKQELLFAILKQFASRDVEIVGEGVVEVLSTASPSCVRPTPIISRDRTIFMFRLRKSAIWSAHGRHGRGHYPQSQGERTLFALLKVNTINFEDPEKIRHKVPFDNLTPLYPMSG